MAGHANSAHLPSSMLPYDRRSRSPLPSALDLRYLRPSRVEHPSRPTSCRSPARARQVKRTTQRASKQACEGLTRRLFISNQAAPNPRDLARSSDVDAAKRGDCGRAACGSHSAACQTTSLLHTYASWSPTDCVVRLQLACQPADLAP